MDGTSTYWSKTSRRRFLGTSLAMTAGLGAAALVGCSSGGGKTTAPAPAGSSAAAGTAAGAKTVSAILGKDWSFRDPNAVPKYGGTLNLSSAVGQLPNLDPLQGTAAFPATVASQVYSSLLRVGRSAASKNEMIIHPNLATEWEIKDPKKWTFKIRPDVKWQNVAPLNGRAMTAEDVKFGINRALTDPTSPYKGVLKTITSMETPDNNTLVLNLSGPDPTLLAVLGDRYAWITPRELHDQKLMKEKMIGTGAFIFNKWEQDSVINFKKNPDYFIKGTPFFDEVNIIQIANEASRLAAFTSEQVHYYGLGVRDWRVLKEDKKKFETETSSRVGADVVFMNFKDPTWKDERVRRAISMAFNRQNIVDFFTDGEGQWRGIKSAQNLGWALSQDELKSNKFYLRHNPAEAKQLMTAAGFPNGLPPMQLTVESGGDDAINDTVQYIAFEVEKNKLGKLNLNFIDRPTLRKNQDEGKYTGLLYGDDGAPLPEIMMLNMRSVGGPKNGSGFGMPDIDAKIDAMMATVDVNERKEKAHAIERELLPMVPWKLTLYDQTNYDAWNVKLKNWLMQPPQININSAPTFSWLA